MKYITGFHALSLKCATGITVTGDFAADWSKPLYGESEVSIFGDWGIEKNTQNKCLKPDTYHANHLRAIVDLMCNEKNIYYLDYIFYSITNEVSNENKEQLFEHVKMLSGLPWWDEINKLMLNRFKFEWFTSKAIMMSGAE